ncbi:MAG: glycerol kinase GlpK [Pseudomonadota bacterium]|nr:glycerol kinase GlpK [Pseudomonadota bacterium]
MATVLAIDQGTTCTTALLVDHRGKVITQQSVELPCHSPQPGYVEFDAEQLWQTALTVSQQVIQQRRVQAIALTNQRESVIVWDANSGKPVAPGISWQCRRTASRCAKLQAKGYLPSIQQKTGLILNAYFSASKLEWLLKQKGIRPQAERGQLLFGTVDSWLLWKMTGEHKTDYTNASRTMLFNINSLEWDTELLKLFHIPACMLPTVQPSASMFGTATPRHLEGIPITGIAGDQQASLFGHMCFTKGTAKNTYGTGSFLMSHAGDQRPPPAEGLITTLACNLTATPQYAVEGSVFSAGSAVQWLRDNLQCITSAAASETISQTVADTAGVHVVPAFAGLGAPFWNAKAQGAIVGLTAHTKPAHIVRATLEAIAWQSAEVLLAMHLQLNSLRVDGGASKNNFLLQFQADILNLKIERPAATDITALGVAYLAGLGVGIWRDTSELQKLYTHDQTFIPQMDAQEREQRLAAWRRAVRMVL